MSKAFLKDTRNDYRDVEAIAEPMQRPTMNFVATKTPEQSDLLSLHRVRSRLIGQRTAAISRRLFVQAAHVVPVQRPAAETRALWSWIERASERLVHRETAIAEGCDLIVMASHGRRGSCQITPRQPDRPCSGTELNGRSCLPLDQGTYRCRFRRTMGCYGQSRLREFVLGGASAYVLKHDDASRIHVSLGGALVSSWSDTLDLQARSQFSLLCSRPIAHITSRAGNFFDISDVFAAIKLLTA